MATEFKIPNLGDNVDVGEVISVLVKEGDSIAKDDPVAELETGKATIEIPSEVSGKIVKVHIKTGDSVAPGQVALTVEGDDGAAAPAAKSAGSKPEEKAAPAPQPESPPPSQPRKKEKPAAPAAAPAPASQPAAAPAPRPATSDGNRIPVAAAPSVRKFAREIGVQIGEVSGSGPNGRISVEDVKAHAKQKLSQPAAGFSGGGGVAVPPLPDFSKWGEVEREKMNNVRKMTAQHMALCWGTIPHVTQQDKADITHIEKLRKQFARRAEAAGGKLTVTAILLKATAAALKVFSQFNASVDLAKEELVRKKYVNIGVAVDTPKGLVVPVVQNVDQKNIIQLCVELSQIAEKAREGKISPADMQGGTFTISNLGGIGGSFFTPIVNHPEVAILGVGRGAQEPVWIDGEFRPRLMLPLSLSYDHRVIDGADGARFIRWLCEALQEPLLLALEG